MSSVEEFRRLNTRPVSVLTIGGFRPTRNPLATHFGLAPVALPDEAWPCVEQLPLFFVCQINLTEAPFVPELLRDIALMTIFVDMKSRQLGRENGDGWLLRAYNQLESLRPLTTPTGATVPRGFEARFDLAYDQPVYDDPEMSFPEGFTRNNRERLENVHRTKIGGYASNIQSDQWWHWLPDEHALESHPARPRYCFQIDSESKVGLCWGDSGCLYFARGTTPGYESRWFLDWQCY